MILLFATIFHFIIFDAITPLRLIFSPLLAFMILLFAITIAAIITIIVIIIDILLIFFAGESCFLLSLRHCLIFFRLLRQLADFRHIDY
jgi:hypothetical protein